ncbi:hypothetical protein T11_3829 [Trichinella zimbabwensis]|uniref:Uncharacterized protein n=1 Tax=Trichinella zimbabwensis TaxID=268475 RepID=A0A0V1GU01_9BILA|nr:hypothetical protein T11_3829 [Trichinella zimbabwensis]
MIKTTADKTFKNCQNNQSINLSVSMTKLLHFLSCQFCLSFKYYANNRIILSNVKQAVHDANVTSQLLLLDILKKRHGMEFVRSSLSSKAKRDRFANSFRNNVKLIYQYRFQSLKLVDACEIIMIMMIKRVST